LLGVAEFKYRPLAFIQKVINTDAENIYLNVARGIPLNFSLVKDKPEINGRRQFLYVGEPANRTAS
jgi:hypothetical protein